MYTSEILRAIANRLGCGIGLKYTDLYKKPKEETRTAKEIIDEIKFKLNGLGAESNEPI